MLCRWLVIAGLLLVGCSHPATVPGPDEALSVRLEMAQQLVASGNHDAAIPLIREVLAKDPTDPTAHLLMGMVLVAKGQDDLARGELVAAFERGHLPNAADELAKLEARARRFDEAIRWHHRAMGLAPRDPALVNNLAFTLFAAGRTEQAVEAFKRALALDPGSGVTYNNLGFAYGKLGRDDDALAAFRQAGPEALAWANLGLARELRGDTAEAMEAYRRALELEPGLPQARDALARLTRDEGEGAPGPSLRRVPDRPGGR